MMGELAFMWLRAKPHEVVFTWLNNTHIIIPSFHFVFSPFTCSNKSCSTLRICLTTTRSASPLHSVWPRTSWTFLTAEVIFYLGIWESIAFLRSTVPCPVTKRALQGPTRRSRVTKSFTGPCTSQQQRGWRVGNSKKSQLNSVSILRLERIILLWYTENQHYSFIHPCFIKHDGLSRTYFH